MIDCFMHLYLKNSLCCKHQSSPLSLRDIPPFKGGWTFQAAFGRHMRKPSLDREGARQGGWDDEWFPALVPLPFRLAHINLPPCRSATSPLSRVDGPFRRFAANEKPSPDGMMDDSLHLRFWPAFPLLFTDGVTYTEYLSSISFLCALYDR